jgi:hypothetical protein
MNIKANYNPTYTLELSQEEFLVLFEAIGTRSNDDWEDYQQEHGLTNEQTEHLKLVSYNVYEDMNNYIEDKVNPPSGEFFTSENWLAQQYKEKYNGN